MDVGALNNVNKLINSILYYRKTYIMSIEY